MLLSLQWEHLLSLLKLLKPPLRKEAGLSDLQRASDKFQEITVSIRDDPRLLSLVEKRRGQKGLREIQGEVLRIACDSILANMVRVTQGGREGGRGGGRGGEGRGGEGVCVSGVQYAWSFCFYFVNHFFISLPLPPSSPLPCSFLPPPSPPCSLIPSFLPPVPPPPPPPPPHRILSV